MGKKGSQSLGVRYEKNQSGCMWGLISMLDFRHARSPRKLLADKKYSLGPENPSSRLKMVSHKNEKNSQKTLNEESKNATIFASKPSVKKLIEEEFSIEKKEKDSNLDHKKTKKSWKKSRDMDTISLNASDSLGSERSCYQNSEQESVNDIFIDRITEEFFHRKSISYVKRHDQDRSGFEEKLERAVREFFSRKFGGKDKDITEDEKIEQSRALLDSLQISRSGEELSLKLVQRREESSSRGVHKIIPRRNNILSRGNESPEGFNRIVILKPGPTSSRKFDYDSSLHSSPESSYLDGKRAVTTDRVTSRFFLSEIKRKLKYTLGKDQEQNGISYDIKESSGGRFPGKDGYGEKKENYPSNGISDIYLEAKKHLSEMLTSGEEGVDFLAGRKNKTLGKVISLPEYNDYPIDSPVNDWNDGFVTAKMRYSASGSLDIDANVSNDIVDEKELEEKTSPNAISVSEEKSFTDDISITREDENVNVSGTCGDGNKGLSECSKQDLLTSPSGSPSQSPTSLKVIEDAENSSDLPKRTSPISVLEPLFLEDGIRTENSTSLPTGISLQPVQIKFEEQNLNYSKNMKTCLEDKESIFSHVKQILLASGLTHNEFYIKWISSERFLDPSLYDEVEFFPNQLCCDGKLLFDCINEVFSDLWVYQYSSFVTVTNLRKVVRAVGEGVYWNLLPLPLPRTLDQIVRKDMERKGTWMDLHFDSNMIGIEVSEDILEDLLEETVLSCVLEWPVLELEES